MTFERKSGISAPNQVCQNKLIKKTVNEIILLTNTCQNEITYLVDAEKYSQRECVRLVAEKVVFLYNSLDSFAFL